MGKFKVGDAVKVEKADNRVGVINEVDESEVPYRVSYPDGVWDWYRESDVVGVNEYEYTYGDVVVMDDVELMYLCPHPTKADRHWLCRIDEGNRQMQEYLDSADNPSLYIETEVVTVFDSQLPSGAPRKQKMTVAEICKELGRDIEIIKG